LVTEVTAVMKTIICSETLRLPTGPQLEDARFLGQGVGTDREGRPVGTQGRPWGQDKEDSGSFRCGRRAEASLACSVEPRSLLG
jgi:hypothetical protein